MQGIRKNVKTTNALNLFSDTFVLDEQLNDKKMNNFRKKACYYLSIGHRNEHMVVGFLIYSMAIITAIVEITYVKGQINLDMILTNQLSIIVCMLAVINVLIAMLAVEYTQQHLCKTGRWDWLDVLAGCLPSILITLAVTLVVLY